MHCGIDHMDPRKGQVGCPPRERSGRVPPLEIRPGDSPYPFVVTSGGDHLKPVPPL